MCDKIINIKKRIANACISASTLRNQGQGVIAIVRDFLANIDLQEFTEITYEEQLNNHTLLLEECIKCQLAVKWDNQKLRNYPDLNRSYFGVARKSLNIFLRDVCNNRFLCGEYPSLLNIYDLLEIPLDSHVVKGLHRDAPDFIPEIPRNFIVCFTIKALIAEQNAFYQEVASSIVRTNMYKGYNRVELDNIYWRNQE